MTTCGLYIFDFEDGADYYYTSAEEDIQHDGNTYSAAPIDRGRPSSKTVDGIEKEGLEVTIDGGASVCGRFSGAGPTSEVRVIISTADRGDISGTIVQIFSGIAVSWKRSGKSMSFQATPRRVDLEHDGPRGRYSTLCRHRLYSEGCGVDSDFWEQTFSVDSVDSQQNIVSIVRPGIEPENYYPGGYLEYSGEARRIIAQDGPVEEGGDHRYTLQISYWIDGLDENQDVAVAPGCPHDIQTCDDRFENADNFGGFPTLERLIQSPFGQGWQS